MRTFDDMLSNQLKDEEFRKEYEAIQPKMDVIRAIVDARTSQNLTPVLSLIHISSLSFSLSGWPAAATLISIPASVVLVYAIKEFAHA